MRWNERNGIPKVEVKEWTLCYGEYDDPAWNGPLFDGRVKVIEKSAYDELQKKLDDLEEKYTKLMLLACRLKETLMQHQQDIIDSIEDFDRWNRGKK